MYIGGLVVMKLILGNVNLHSTIYNLRGALAYCHRAHLPRTPMNMMYITVRVEPRNASSRKEWREMRVERE